MRSRWAVWWSLRLLVQWQRRRRWEDWEQWSRKYEILKDAQINKLDGPENDLAGPWSGLMSPIFSSHLFHISQPSPAHSWGTSPVMWEASLYLLPGKCDLPPTLLQLGRVVGINLVDVDLNLTPCVLTNVFPLLPNQELSLPLHPPASSSPAGV